MNKDLHDIDDLFKNSIDGHREELPPEIWQNIDHTLDKKQAAFYKRRYFAVRGAAILLLLAGGITIAAILHFNRPAAHPASTESAEKTTPASTLDSSKEDEAFVRSAPLDGPEKEVNGPLMGKGQDLTESKEKQWNTHKGKPGIHHLPNAGSEETVNYGSADNRSYSVQKYSERAARASENKARNNSLTIKKSLLEPSEVPMAQQAGNTRMDQGRSAYTPLGETGLLYAAPRTNYIKETNPGTGGRTGLARTFLTLDENASRTMLPGPSYSQTAQRNTRQGKYRQGWSLSAMYAQDVNLNTLKDDDHFRDPRNNSQEAKRTEQESTSFSTGLGIQKQVGNHLFLQTGLGYFFSKTTIQPKLVFAAQDSRGDVRYQFHCSSGNSYLPTKSGAAPSIGDSIQANYSTSTLSYLQLPFLVSFKMDLGRFSVLPSLGLQSSFLLSGKLYSSLAQPNGDEDVASRITGLRSVYFSGVVQPEIDYKLSDRISFDLVPNINFSLSPINRGTAVRTYQNMINLGAGLRVRL